jgi:hypothetical protein
LVSRCTTTSAPYLSTTRPGSSSASLKQSRQASFSPSSIGLRRAMALRSRAAKSSSHSPSLIPLRDTMRNAICDAGLYSAVPSSSPRWSATGKSAGGSPEPSSGSSIASTSEA